MSRPGKRATSTDVARAAGVSQTTVSFVLNDRPGQRISEETRQRVLEAAERLDYRPHGSARALAAGRSDVVLLSVPDLPIGAGISRFVEELAAALAARGLTLVTHLSGAHGRPLPDVCAAVNASAVIGFESFDPETVQALHRIGADVVLPLQSDDLHSMQPIGRLQAEHLLARGHRYLGYAMPAHPGLRPMAEERLQGVRDACAAAGIEPPMVLTTSLDLVDAAQAVTQWAAQSVTGVCAFNDETAIAILAGMHDNGLTAPADFAVIGSDDIPTARLAIPALTTIAFDLHAVGRRRAEAVVASLSGLQLDQAALPPVVPPKVIQRAST
ncbi:LacI family DNA-binding transcriptional regulator [Catenulispora rubra]|uniref:LacI family DNA-binding transcriptional regulator n=1 Tax=Catenulispora rubra TaxID=280293 RepID=UPI0018921471|nr:LacI family DNA-binding transcriptional regulator [Catenulispora rubra]